jgi:molybdopterin-biosynthesis enzyme MoeA-like protein
MSSIQMDTPMPNTQLPAQELVEELLPTMNFTLSALSAKLRSIQRLTPGWTTQEEAKLPNVARWETILEKTRELALALETARTISESVGLSLCLQKVSGIGVPGLPRSLANLFNQESNSKASIKSSTKRARTSSSNSSAAREDTCTTKAPSA